MQTTYLPRSIQGPNELPDFSLVPGGPLFQLLVRSRLATPALDLLKRRIVIITLFAWLPLLLLSLVNGRAWCGNPDAVEPAQVVSRLNALYPMASNGNHYFTMVYGLLDTAARRLRFTAAGHPGPILAREGTSPRRFDAPGFPVGIVDDGEYEQSAIDLQPGDRLYLHSDGLTEEISPQGEEFGDERLLAAIAAGRGLGLSEAVESLVQEVVAWRGEEHLKDDVSILAVAVA